MTPDYFSRYADFFALARTQASAVSDAVKD